MEHLGEVATAAGRSYGSFKELKAVALVGSVARNRADAHSDVDLRFYWEDLETPPPSLRELFPGEAKSEGVVQFSFGPMERAKFRGVHLDLSHLSIKDLEQRWDDLEAGVGLDLHTQHEIAYLVGAEPILGEAWFQEQRARAEDYPSALADRMIRHWLILEPRHRFEERLRSAPDDLGSRQTLVETGVSLMGALMGLNGVYGRPVYEKMSADLIERMELKPPAFLERLHELVRSPPASATALRHSLIKETLALLHKHHSPELARELERTYEGTLEHASEPRMDSDRLVSEMVQHYRGRSGVVGVGDASWPPPEGPPGFPHLTVFWQTSELSRADLSVRYKLGLERLVDVTDPARTRRHTEYRAGMSFLTVDHFTLDGMDRAAERLAEESEADPWDMRAMELLLRSRALHGGEVISGMRASFREFPRPLAPAAVQRYRPPIPPSTLLRVARKRDCDFYTQAHLLRLVLFQIHILSALEGEYSSPLFESQPLRQLARLRSVPPEIAERLASLLEESLPDALAEASEIHKRVLALAEERLPGLELIPD